MSLDAEVLEFWRLGKWLSPKLRCRVTSKLLSGLRERARIISRHIAAKPVYTTASCHQKGRSRLETLETMPVVRPSGLMKSKLRGRDEQFEVATQVYGVESAGGRSKSSNPHSLPVSIVSSDRKSPKRQRRVNPSPPENEQFSEMQLATSTQRHPLFKLVRGFMEQEHKTQKDIAGEVGIAAPDICRWLNNKSKPGKFERTQVLMEKWWAEVLELADLKKRQQKKR